jgi:hypothetical protein
MWLALAALTGFLVCIASGVIPSAVTPTGTPEAFVPRRVDETQGWGKPSTYTGRYQIRTPTSAGEKGSSGGAATTATQGSLMMFLRAEHPGDPLIPSGMLSLHVSSGNMIGYLTDLRSNGGTVRATIRGGTFQGPAIGSLTGAFPKNGAFRGIVKAPGVGSVEGEFVRVAGAPQIDQAQTLSLP